MRRDRSPVTLLRLSLALILAGGVGAWLVQTDRGQIQVKGLTFPTEDGQWVTADLFRPDTATEKSPAPLVVVCPGFERSKETMDGYSIELARRGMVVITIDPYSQGASSSSLQRQSATVEGYGVVPVVHYVYATPNLNYVDKSRIGAAGYSAGGNGVLQFVGGYVLTLTDKILASVDANLAVDYAYYDEGAYRNELDHARLERAPEALRLVNSGLGADKVSSVEIDKVYGDPAQRNMRVVHNTRMIHPLMPYDLRHIGNVVTFFTTAFGLQPAMQPSDQTWFYKELFTLMALTGALLFLVPCAALLLRLPLFRELVRPTPPLSRCPQGAAGFCIGSTLS